MQPAIFDESLIERPEILVTEIVAAAGGRLVSRIRLQKIAYLLDQLGAKSGFGYSYHHYGPYSRELESAVLDARAFGLIEEKFDHRESDGARYSIFEVKNRDRANRFETLASTQLREIVRKLVREDITVLELAATAHWLSEKEKTADWEQELKLRKGTKTAGGRLQKAKQLLESLKLPPG